MAGENDRQLPIPKPDDTPSTEITMDLETAKRILGDVRKTSEETIIEGSPLDQFAGHPVEQIRQALGVVSRQLISTHPEGFIPNTVSKEVPRIDATLTLGLFKPITRMIKELAGETDPREEVVLSLHNPKEFERGINLNFRLPLTTPPNENVLKSPDALLIGYRARGRTVSLRSFGFEGYNLGDYKFMIRGLRWTAANLVEWDTIDMIMPEELDNFLPPKL